MLQASSDSSISSSQAVTPTLNRSSVLCDHQNGEAHPTSPLSPISDLCNSLRACKLSSDTKSQSVRYPVQPPANRQPQTQQLMHNNNNNNNNNTLNGGDVNDKRIEEMPQHVSPHLYMEKSCQVCIM